MREPRPDKSDAPTLLAAEEFALGTRTVRLEHPEPNAGLAPVRGNACHPVSLKYLYSSLDLVDDDCLGCLKRRLVRVRPYEGRGGFQQLPEWSHHVGP